MLSVFLIEDDERIRRQLAAALTEAGHGVHAVSTGADALRDIVKADPDIIVLDLGLPDFEGRDVLAMLRGVTDVPVVVATARDDEREIVQVLDAGADDYLVKPFSVAQLEARLRAVLRRTAGAARQGEVLTVGGLVVDCGARTASLDGERLQLTRLEFDLLAHLARRTGSVVGRRELMAEVWNQPYGGADKTIDVHVSWLRRKLGESAREPRYLETIRGVGLRLRDPAG